MFINKDNVHLLKRGDRLRCITWAGTSLTAGKIYTLEKCLLRGVKLKEIPNRVFFNIDVFELVEQTKVKSFKNWITNHNKG